MKQKSSEYGLLMELYIRLLPFQVLLIVINSVNGIVDSLYASNAIGKAAMSAIGLFGPFNLFLYAASIVFVSGSQMLYGRYIAVKRERLQALFTSNLLISLGVAILTSLFLVAGVLTNATRVLVSQADDLKMLNRYILGQVIGIPALVIGQQLFAFLSLENQTRRTMTASIVCFVSKTILNHVFVVLFPMGTFGLGLSSALSMWAFLGVQAAYYLAGKSELRFSLRSFDRAEAAQIVRLGYPAALSRFSEMIRCLITNGLVLKYVGSVGISAFSATNSLMAVMWALPFGMVAVSRMLFSISVGEEDRKSLVNTMTIALSRGMLLMLGIAGLLVLFAEPLTCLFYRDPSDPVYHMTVMGFRILPLCMPMSIVTLNFACYLQTVEKKLMSIVVPIIDGVVGVVLFSFLLIPSLKLNGLYIAYILNGFLCAAVIVVDSWLTRKRFPRSIEDLMAIPERIGVPQNERIDISVRSMDEVMTVSRQITDFCRERGIDRRRAYYAGLCMEEMAGNVVSHGFARDRKKHSIDIRVAHKAEDIILLIRDDCTAFNPSERARAMEPDDMGKNVGIRLVYGIARDVRYQNLLGLNVLTMRI